MIVRSFVSWCDFWKNLTDPSFIGPEFVNFDVALDQNILGEIIHLCVGFKAFYTAPLEIQSY